MRRILTVVVIVFLMHAPLRAAASYTGQPYDPPMGGARSTEMIFAAPGQPDFLFTEDGTIAIDCHPLPRALKLTWKVCRNLIKKPLREGVVEVDVNNRFPIRLEAAGLLPGFYDLHVEVKLTDRETLVGKTAFGWQARDQKQLVLKPEDFDAFWRNASAAVEAIDLELTREPYKTFAGDVIGKYNIERASLPEHPDPEGEKYQTVEVFKVAFKSVGATIYCWYAKPPGQGPFPGLLILPGAGNRWRPIPLEAARHGYAALDLHVHGEPNDWPNEKYSPLPKEDPSKAQGLLYYQIALHALQGVNALLAQPEVDPELIFAEGGSQGGYLTTVVCAQDRRIKGGVATITYMADRPYHYWVRAVNRAKGDGADGIDLDVLGKLNQKALSERYIDAQNHAMTIACPMFFSAGLVDGVSPPSTVMALHQKVPRSVFVPMPNTGHDISFACDRAAWRWLEKLSGVREE